MSEKTNEVSFPDRKAVSKEKYQELIAPFPEEALSTDSSRGFDLTSVKAQYVKERLNEVFGVFNWRMEGEYEEKEDGGVLFIGALHLFLQDDIKDPNTAYHKIPAVGFSGKKKLLGDAYKSAQTDALSKACSNLGIANDVFKGKVTPPSKKGKPVAKKNVTTINKPASFQGKPAKSASDF